MSIRLDHVSKRFGSFIAVDDVSLTVPEGQLVALLGPSGSGKTTLLRIIAGLDVPDSGAVWLDGEEATDRRARDRGVGFVFQHYALFRHMTVEENVAFGLESRPRKSRPSREEIAKKVGELLHLVGLAGHATRYPSQLSGGQRQRVALARALAVEPKVLLLDEPFGSLDASVRHELRRWLRSLHDELKVTSVFVTHDQEEALELADRVVIFNQGRIEQIGTADEVCDAPATPFVYQFIGRVNFVDVPLAAGVPQWDREHGDVVRVGFRSHDVDVFTECEAGAMRVEVRTISRTGAVAKLDCVTPSGELVHVEWPREALGETKHGSSVWIRPRDVRVM